MRDRKQLAKRIFTLYLPLVLILLFILSTDPALMVFILFCLYALSGFVYQFYLWYTGQPNPVIPQRSDIDFDEPEDEQH